MLQRAIVTSPGWALRLLRRACPPPFLRRARPGILRWRHPIFPRRARPDRLLRRACPIPDLRRACPRLHPITCPRILGWPITCPRTLK